MGFTGTISPNILQHFWAPPCKASSRVLRVSPTATLYIELPAQVYAVVQIPLGQSEHIGGRLEGGEHRNGTVGGTVHQTVQASRDGDGRSVGRDRMGLIQKKNDTPCRW